MLTVFKVGMHATFAFCYGAMAAGLDKEIICTLISLIYGTFTIMEWRFWLRHRVKDNTGTTPNQNLPTK